MVQSVVDRQFPSDAAALSAIFRRWKWKPFVAHPQKHLPDRLQLAELVEHDGDCFLHAPVRIFLDAIIGHFEVADH